MKYNVIVNGACMVFFMCLAQPVVSMFYNGDSAAIATTIAGFRLYTLCMIFYGTNLIYRSYLQGTGQIKKSYALSICDCFLCPFLMSLLLGSLFGIPSIWLCYVLGEGITTIVMLALFRFRKCDVQGFGAFVPMPDALGKDILAIHEYSISENREDLSVRLSQDVSVFCTENGATVRQTYLVSLTVEEVVGNIMERGFSDGKAHHIDLRILRKSDGWTLRIRDDCPLFNPARYLEQFTDDDPSANIGLKLIRGIASDMVYLNALKLNNLMIRI
ncbi:MAG: ATP-binding protein, partial [Ruminococcus sp.]|nr:ATP-binding protein [Ruminococcus sp.]